MDGNTWTRYDSSPHLTVFAELAKGEGSHHHKGSKDLARSDALIGFPWLFSAADPGQHVAEHSSQRRTCWTKKSNPTTACRNKSWVRPRLRAEVALFPRNVKCNIIVTELAAGERSASLLGSLVQWVSGPLDSLL